MKHSKVRGTLSGGCAALATVLGMSLVACEQEKASEPAETETAQLKPAAEEGKPGEAKPGEGTEPAAKADEPSAGTDAPEAADSEKEDKARPSNIDTELTDARRAAVEKAYPDAKGFLSALELEEQLKKNAGIKAKEAAVKAFDKTARSKWVLFAGPMVNLTDDTFDLAVTYTPQAANDPMGMSRQFFTVTLSDVEGYDKGEFKAGAMVVVLAKYDGGGKASKGYELVAADNWK